MGSVNMAKESVKLISFDNQKFEVDVAVLCEFKAIDMDKEIVNHDRILLPNVSGKTLAMVIEYCEYHVKNQKTSDEAGTSKGASDEPGTSKRASDEPGTSKRASDEPGTSKRASDEAGTSKSASDEASTSEAAIKAWDAEFMKKDQQSLFDLVVAANFLGIEKLIHLTCGTVADMIKDKGPAEIRQIFQIKNDYTPEEEEEVYKETRWVYQ